MEVENKIGQEVWKGSLCPMGRDNKKIEEEIEQ